MLRLSDAAAAASVLKSGGLLVHPTMGLWGIGASPIHTAAMARLQELKGSATRKGFIVISAAAAALEGWHRGGPELQHLLSHRFAGPVTFIVAAGPKAPDAVVSDTSTVAIRVERHPATARLLQITGQPMVSTSLNLPGDPPAATLEEVPAALSAQLDAAYIAGRHPAGHASTIAEVTDGQVQICRAGLVDANSLRNAWQSR